MLMSGMCNFSSVLIYRYPGGRLTGNDDRLRGADLPLYPSAGNLDDLSGEVGGHFG